MPNRLKSLELHGYKTFASRTVFDFPSAVTAIVGPNGSGKSNIADALRWVLGEQSYSLLRGKKTEDMIFAGSEQRSRAGMAAVTVVFDNEDHWLPIDFSEVAISRRAYRDGQNEYVLNGQRVRLKDVSELLSQSGLAERTYTIIGQGLVDAALALKAEERRRLFEEAAGIGLHRSRKEEALRRLEITLRNLERVQDILAELEPRLRSLERQARRALEYERLKEQLRELLREWYGYHWHRAQTELTEAQVAARQQDRQLRTARHAQHELDQQLQTFRGDLQEIRERLSSWHRESAGLHTRRESVNRELAVSDERQRFLAEQEREYREQLAGLEEQIILLKERLGETRSEMERFQGELLDAEQQAGIANQALAEQLQAREIAGTALEQARQKVAALEARQVELTARRTERQDWMSRQAETLIEIRARVEAAEAACQLAEQTRLQKAQDLEQISRLRLDAQGEISAQQEKVTELEASLQEIAGQVSAMKTDWTRLQTQLQVLQQAEDALTGYSEGARLLLEAARSQQVRGVQGALSSRIDVPEGLEQAITAALGEFLEAVVLEKGEETDQALGFLEGKPGRGILLPIDSLVAGEPALWPARDSEVLGIAAKLVEAPEELRQVIDLLLGRTLVVRNRQSARRVVAQARRAGLEKFGYEFRAVTLQGEVYYAHGAIQAGQENRSGALSQGRQRKRLQAEIISLEKALGGLEEKSIRTEVKLANERAKLEEQSELYQQQIESEEAARSSHSQIELAFEQASSQAGWQREQETRLKTEASRAEVELDQVSAELDGIAISLDAARKIQEDCQAVFLQTTIEDVQEQASHWSLQTALTRRAFEEIQARLREREAALDEIQARRSSIVARIEDVGKQSSELDDRKQTLRLEEDEVGKSLEALQELIRPAEQDLDQRESEQLQKQTLEAQARQSLNQAEQYHSQAKINLIRRQEALEALRRRVEDDFGLVAFEYAEEITGPNPLPLAGLVEQLPVVEEISPETEEALKRQRILIRRMGPVNPEAQNEYQEVKARYEFLVEQVGDLRKAEADVHTVIAQLDEVMEQEFKLTFDRVAEEFHTIFGRLFGGGTARLVMTDPADLTTTGIDIEARLPGRREQGLSLLSGGERSLTAVALVFSLLKVSPTPFCVLDEVDAMLDEANVGRFRDLLRELSQTTQFILITHNRNTVQVAEVIYGITMGHDSTSQTVSLKMDQIEQAVAESPS
jgi:chromosome segregation protein